MNNGKKRLRNSQPADAHNFSSGIADRGPRQDERKFAHPFDRLGQDVVEGRVDSFQTDFSSEAVVFVRPRVRL